MPVELDQKLASIERHYRKVYRHLDPSNLTRHEDWPRHTDGVAAGKDEADDLFLDFYSVDGLRLALEHYGFLEELRHKNLGEPKLSLERHPKGYDVARIHVDSTPVPLVELIAQISTLPESCGRFFDPGGSRFLYVRWLRMQDPRAAVDPDRPLLPGQDHPGLGLGRQMLVLLQMICGRLELSGVVEMPERLHNAALYFRRFRFLDPEVQGRLTAILRDTRDRTLVDLAWGVELGGLIDRTTGKTFSWEAKEQVLPRSGPVLDYLNSDDYLHRAREVMESSHFHLSLGDLARDLAVSDDAGHSRIK